MLVGLGAPARADSTSPGSTTTTVPSCSDPNRDTNQPCERHGEVDHNGSTTTTVPSCSDPNRDPSQPCEQHSSVDHNGTTTTTPCEPTGHREVMGNGTEVCVENPHPLVPSTTTTAKPVVTASTSPAPPPVASVSTQPTVSPVTGPPQSPADPATQLVTTASTQQKHHINPLLMLGIAIALLGIGFAGYKIARRHR